MVFISTDGSCNSSTGEGSWSYILDGKCYSGREWDTTSNRMELMGVIKALEHFIDSQEIVILSDSKYVVEGMNRFMQTWRKNGWRVKTGKPVKNKDLWRQILEAQKNHNSVAYRWIPREKNSLADSAAKNARKNP